MKFSIKDLFSECDQIHGESTGNLHNPVQNYGKGSKNQFPSFFKKESVFILSQWANPK